MFEKLRCNRTVLSSLGKYPCVYVSLFLCAFAYIFICITINCIYASICVTHCFAILENWCVLLINKIYVVLDSPEDSESFIQLQYILSTVFILYKDLIKAKLLNELSDQELVTFNKTSSTTWWNIPLSICAFLRELVRSAALIDSCDALIHTLMG